MNRIPIEILCDLFRFVDGITLLECRFVCKRWVDIMQNFEHILPLKYDLRVDFHIWPDKNPIEIKLTTPLTAFEETLPFKEAHSRFFGVPRAITEFRLWLNPNSLEAIAGLKTPIKVKNLEITMDYFDENFLSPEYNFFERMINPVERIKLQLLGHQAMNKFLQNPKEFYIPIVDELHIRCCACLNPEIVSLEKLLDFIFQENATFGVCTKIFLPPVYNMAYRNFLIGFCDV